MYLVDEQDRARILLHFLDHAFQALLEVTAILRARNQRTHVERIDRRITENLGDTLFDDHPSEAFGQRRLADARVTHVQRIVLPAAAQYLHRSLDLDLAADQRIDLAVDRQLVEIRRKLLQWRVFGLRCRLH